MRALNFLGTYLQKAKADKKEQLVLAKKDGKALLLSKYGLDCQKNNTNFAKVTWETCTLRKWLNNEFFITAFSEKEKSLVSKAMATAGGS